MDAYLVFYVRGARIGSVVSTPASRAGMHRLMRVSLIQRDITGTEHYHVLAVR
jgi:hypothetical protein